MATDPPGELLLSPLKGEARTVDQWVTTFHLALVVVDPFTYESAWLLEEAGRVLTGFTAADVRVGWLVTGTAEEARQFLGPWAEELLTFADPGRVAVKALGLQSLPAWVHIDMLGHVAESVEGWQPAEWRPALHALANVLSWIAPTVPGPKAPGPFPGSPALA
ncbi:MAG: hypothetical protein QOE63_1107 [Acidimicrobiaceae bacterium]